MQLLRPKNFYKLILLTIYLLFGQALIQAESDKPITHKVSGLSPLELKIWNDPKFQKRFAESYMAVTEVEPKITKDQLKQMKKIMELISSDELDEAAEKLEKLREGSPAAIYDFTVANIYFQTDRLDLAAEAYKMAVDDFPRYQRAWNNLGLIYIRKGEFEKAIPALTRVLELGGGDSLIYGLLGYASSSVDNNITAETAYRMAILLDPATMDWKMGLARSLFKQEKFHEAVALCDHLIKTQPDRADLWLLQANAYIGLNKPLKAAEIYELVDQMGKSTEASLNMLGDIYINEELYEMAVKSYVRAMDKKPDGDTARVVRAARVLAAKGALKETRQLIEHIEKVKGENIEKDIRKDMLKLRARLAVADGSGEEEVQVLKEIVELDPLDGEALILLGQHSARNEDPEKAVFYYERAAAIEKFEADAKVRHAQLLVGQGKYTEALVLLRRAQTIKPRSNIQEYLEQVERVSKSR